MSDLLGKPTKCRFCGEELRWIWSYPRGRFVIPKHRPSEALSPAERERVTWKGGTYCDGSLRALHE